MKLRAGEVVERYEVLEPLGEGGMAAVYLVRHLELGSAHALKIVTATSASIRDRLIVEGRAQATLRHPNIVAVTDTVLCRGNPGLIMEYVAGPPLNRWIRAERPSLDDALAVFGAIVRGVARAHRKDFVHRDLKPDNVMLDVTDDDITPKVADFGIAKALSDGGAVRTVKGSKMGTPAYMAPEQLDDASGVDARADVFSLGAILYELVTAKQAFQGSSPSDVLQNIAKGRYRPVEELFPEVPEPVQLAIFGCLTLDPAERIQNCDELKEVLGPHWSGTGRLDPDGSGGIVARHLAVSASNRLGNAQAPGDSGGTWGGSLDGTDDQVLTPIPDPGSATEHREMPPSLVATVPFRKPGHREATVDAGGGLAAQPAPQPMHRPGPPPPAQSLPPPTTTSSPAAVATGEHRTGAFGFAAAIGATGLAAAGIGLAAVVGVAAIVFWPSSGTEEPPATGESMGDVLPDEPAGDTARPSKPQPKPVGRQPVKPKPEPPPKAAAPAKGRVALTGQRPEGAVLVAGDRRVFVDAPVPPGAYTLRGDWGAGETDLAIVDVPAGGTVTVSCIASLEACSVQ